MLKLWRAQQLRRGRLAQSTSLVLQRYASDAPTITKSSMEYPKAPNVGIGVVILRKFREEPQVAHLFEYLLSKLAAL